MSSRKQKLASHLQVLREESRVFFEKKTAYDQDINRAVSKLYSLNQPSDNEQKSKESPEPPRIPEVEAPPRDESSPIESPPEDDNFEPDEPSPSWAKKAYKQIARHTHPDKTKAIASTDPKRANELANLYLDAVTAYKSKNYDTIVEIASQLDISIEIPDSEIESSLEVRINKIRKEMEDAQSSLSWAWGVSFGNIAKRVSILRGCIQIMNIPEPDTETLEKIVRSVEEL